MPSERIVDVPGIVGDLTDHLVVLLPQPELAAPTTVPDGVCGDLIDRDGDVLGPIGGQAQTPTLPVNKFAYAGQVVLGDGMVADQRGWFR